MPFRYWRTTIRLFQSFLFHSEQFQFSQAFLVWKCSIPWSSYWTHSNRSVTFLCWGPKSWMQHCRWGFTWASFEVNEPKRKQLCCKENLHHSLWIFFSLKKSGEIKATEVSVVVSVFNILSLLPGTGTRENKKCWYSSIATIELSYTEQQFAKTLLFPV